MRYDYGEAILLVDAGHFVRRASWAASWLFLAQGGPADGPDKVYLIEKRPGEDERATEFVARDADLMAADWEIVAPPATAGVPAGGETPPGGGAKAESGEGGAPPEPGDGAPPGGDAA